MSSEMPLHAWLKRLLEQTAAAFGKMGTERNGSFLRDDDFAKRGAANMSSASPSEIGPVATQRAASVARSLVNASKPKGRVPVPASGP